MPAAGAAGHLSVNEAIISWLHSLGHQVDILLTRPRLNWPWQPIDRRFTVAGIGLFTRTGWAIAHRPRDVSRIIGRRILKQLPAPLSRSLRRTQREYGGADAVLGSFITPAQIEFCADWVARHHYDAVLIDTIFRAPLLDDDRLTRAKTLLIAHDLFFRRHRALGMAGYRLFPEKLSQADEACLLGRAGAIAAIQPEEAAIIAAMCPSCEVVCAPMPAIPCPRPDDQPRVADRLVFIGSASLPNLDGLRWFFESIWPRLRVWRPSVTLDVIGDCGAALSHRPDGVAFLGRVKDLAPILHQAQLAIAPLRAASGLNIKLLDYARHGLMTVATPQSLTGFARDDQAPFVAAGDALAFTTAIANALEDRTYRDERALGYIARHYDSTTSFAGIAQILGLD